ncbi:MAG: condensation domain-containing protein, partial [Candidatus Binatia bacterium]
MKQENKEGVRSDLASRFATLSPAAQTLLRRKLRKKGLAALVNETIRPRETAEPAPLSFAQERLWFLDQLEPVSAVYNIARAFRLTGPLDVSALERSLNEIVRRHESLRTSFKSVAGSPRQVIASSLVLSPTVIDVSERPESEREDEAARLAGEETRRPFDLSRGPLIRATLVRLHEEQHVFLLNMHHIVS